MQIELSNMIFPAPPRSIETKKEESAELLRMIFSLETTTFYRFQVWLDILKMTYFPLLFPKPCQEMQIVKDGGTGVRRKK
jgi:hypothetical protein